MNLVLDNEATQALMDAAHPKHRRVLAHLAAVTSRGAQSGRFTVPATVMAEAGWDRGDARHAAINRLHPRVDVLDEQRARQCVRLLARKRVGVVDAHVVAAANSQPGPVVLLTSDTSDLTPLAEGRVTVVRL